MEQVELDAVDAEVGMEVSVQQDFSPELNDNTSKAYVDFSDTFRNQVRGRGGAQGGDPPPLKLSLGPWVSSGLEVQM